MVLTLVLSMTFSTQAYAQEDYVHPDCDDAFLKIGKRWCTFKKDPLALGHNITLTTVDAAKSLAIDVPTMVLAERTYDQVALCSGKIFNDDLGEIPSSLQSDDDCTDLKAASILTGKYGYPTNSTSYGSLIGLANAAQDIAFNEPPPVNLAYYAKYTAQKIPVVNNTAFAQGEIQGDFFLSLLLGAWEKLRNIAYGILALVMVVIGIMIMVRHKINPQTVVTIQSAIPRIVIAVLLITFSYPIGAMAIALIYPLSAVAAGLLPITDAAGFDPSIPVSTYLIRLSIGQYTLAGAGISIMIFLVVILFVGIIVLIKALISLIMSYLKIVYAVLVAPFIFAWSAVPGNEALVTDWFKKLAVNVVTIPAMVFGINLAIFIAIEFAEASTAIEQIGGLGGGYVPLAGAFAGGFLAPIVVIIVLWQVGKFPKMIEEGILGVKKR